MKKSSKILGSIALSAALCMGTAVPAFAADQYPGKNSDPVTAENGTGPNGIIENAPDVKTPKGAGTIVDPNSDNTDAQGSSTVVTVSTYTSQINVTVPLYLPIWLDTAGSDAVVPSDGAYYIRNASPVAIAITNAEYGLVTSSNPGIKFAEGAKGTLKKNEFNISLTPAPTGFKKLEMNDSSANTGKVDAELNWAIEKGITLDLPVSAASGTIDHAISDAKLATITYTVSVNTGNVKPWDGTKTAVDDPEDPVTQVEFKASDVMSTMSLVNAINALTTMGFHEDSITLQNSTGATVTSFGGKTINKITINGADAVDGTEYPADAAVVIILNA